MPQTTLGDSRILYVSIETRVRELDAKLLFSLLAARAGFQVVLGPKWLFAVNVPRLPRGLFVFKTLNLMDAPAIRAFKKRGHSPVAWDEEGADHITPVNYLRNINDEAVLHADVIFSWGEHQTAMLAAKYPDAAGRIKTTGNPRWDLLRPEWRRFYDAEAGDLRARHGRFILINTNFSFYNAWFEDKIGGVLKMNARTGAFNKDDPEDMQVLQAIYTFEKNMFRAYTALLPKLSKAFPEHSIILRPHPIEKKESWLEHTGGLANVHIIHEGGVIPWIMAAEAVVQTGCTTGFEALTLDRPTLSYCPYPSPVVDWHLANFVCPRILDDDSLIDHLRQIAADPASFDPVMAKGMQEMSRHIANLTGKTASEAIVESLGAVAGACERERGPFSRQFVLDEKLEDYPRNQYLELKFPSLSNAEMAQMMARFAALDPRVGNVKATEIAESCFLLQRTD